MSCNILLVEDEPIARRNITIFLQRASHNVHQAETGEAAVDLISRINFNTVISDFRLPGRINGIDVLKHQQEKSPGKTARLGHRFWLRSSPIRGSSARSGLYGEAVVLK